jgi:hypothetical protein
MAKLTCDYANCNNEITEGTGSKGGLPICKTCRGAFYRANKLGPKWVEHRREVMTFLGGRFDYLSPHMAKQIHAAEKRVKGAKREARAH